MEHATVRLALSFLFVGLLVGCPATNSKPCTQDTDCEDGVCRRGACGPACETALDCAEGRVCVSGICVESPECSQNSDCADGFRCAQGECRCIDDTSCAANQTCVEGRCEAKPRCTDDSACATDGKRCEVTQGVCLPVCRVAADCAPTLDATLANGLYACTQGTCQRRCVNDATCGTGLLCTSGLCRLSECRTLTDCAAGRYCTSATNGRCLDYRGCAGQSDCTDNERCLPFAANQCPPGFDCRQQICQELPRCFMDADCALAFGVPGPSTPVAFCEDQHCRVTSRCDANTPCTTADRDCVAGLCVPASCRGLTDCPADEVCVGGSCVRVPLAGDIASIALSPQGAVLQVGQSLQLTLVGYRLSGESVPLPEGEFTVLDDMGNPSNAATVTRTARLTAQSAGRIRVRGSLAGAVVNPREATFTLYAVPSSGKAVRVVDAATSAPLEGVQVRGCSDPPVNGTCPSSVDATTDAQGEALFPSFTSPLATFSIASPELRSDGFPRYERVSVLRTSRADVLIPLGENPVHAAAGFQASIAFTNVHSSGNLWAGFAVLSVNDPADISLPILLGESFQTPLPFIGQRIPIPGSVVLFSSPGLGIPNEIKGKSFGLGQPGRRATVGFAGKTDLGQVTSLRSVQFLSYVGAFDFAVAPFNRVTSLPRIPDAADIDGDGLCASPQQCPSGTEEVPDYSQFTSLSLTPSRVQMQRTEVVLPSVSDGFDTVLVARVQKSPELGFTPLGFSSVTAGALNANGERAVGTLTLQSGVPYGGLETGEPGIWAWAVPLGTQGLLGVDTSMSGRLTGGARLPERVVVPPFLPLASGSTYSSGSRTFSPGQPAWNTLVSAGGELARIVLTGTHDRHVVYFAMEGGQTSAQLLSSPEGAGADAANQPTSTLDVVVLQLSAGVDAEDLFDLNGPNLTHLPSYLNGYSRFRR